MNDGLDDGHALHPEIDAVVHVAGYAALFGAWALWFLTLPISLFLLWAAFDGNMAIRHDTRTGLTVATWVAGVPLALSVAQHVAEHGFTFPDWELRWLLVLALGFAWIAILAR